jgi:hypothetical protein
MHSLPDLKKGRFHQVFKVKNDSFAGLQPQRLKQELKLDYY